VKRFVRRLKDFQESLGTIYDASMATRLAQQFAGGGHAELGVPVGALAVSSDHARRAAMRRLDKQWEAFRRQKRFW
jgi:hypothetical protein